MEKLIQAIISIACLGAIVYSNTFHCSFHLDDIASITDNFAIRNIHNLQNIWNFWPSRFITYLSIAFNYHFNGLDVFGYHLFNLAVHLASAVLVWWLTLLTLSTPAMKGNKITRHANVIALFAGLVFVSHPIQTQAVTYIVQRAASMVTLFYVASLCFYVKSRLLQVEIASLPTVARNDTLSPMAPRNDTLSPMAPRNDTISKVYYIGALLTAIMAMFTKETAITLPLTILLYEFSFLKTKKSLNSSISPAIPFLFFLFIFSLITLLTTSGAVRLHQVHNEAGISYMHYFLTQCRVMVTYIRLLFIPLNQNLDYDYPISKSIFELPALVSLLFLIIVLFSAKRLFSKYRLVSFSILWFFLTLLPESSFLPIRDVIFEHRLYLPMVGYSMFLVSGMYYLLGKNTLKTMVIVLTMIITCNSVLTYQRNKAWKDEFSLWDDTVRKSPHKARPYNGLGDAYLDRGNLTQAMSDYNKAIELDPNISEVYSNRAIVYINYSNFTQAIVDLNKAIKLKPNNAKAYNSRGSIYLKQGNLIEAMSDYNKAIELDPNMAEAYSNRGSIYSKEGNLVQAMSDYNKAIEINPNMAAAYSNRGNLYAKEGNLIEAMSDHNKAIEINP